MDLVTTILYSERRLARLLCRRLFVAPILVRWLVVVAISVAIGYLDIISSAEISLGFYYLVPVVYATWFIRARAGMLVAVMAAAIWATADFSGETAVLSHEVLAWSAVARLSFFVLSVVIVALAKRAAVRLFRGVSEKTRRLRLEVQRRRKLEQDMIETRAREQLRLAQDLHGGLGQYLSALAFHSRMLADDLHEISSSHASQAERIVALVRETNQLTRQLNRALGIPHAGAEGLAAAVRALVVEFEGLTGIKCELVVERELPALDEFQTVMLFRIVQEAFNNSAKHARPRTIRVSLTRSESQIGLMVVNDGYVASERDLQNTGSGSLTMKLRAEMLGAQLQAGPAGAGGFKVECRLPLERVIEHAGAN